MSNRRAALEGLARRACALVARRDAGTLAAATPPPEPSSGPSFKARFKATTLATTLAAGCAAALWAQQSDLACERSEDDTPLALARKRILPRWKAIELELSREPQFYSKISPRHLVYRERSGVEISQKGKMLSIRFPVRPGSDTSTLLCETVGRLSGRGDDPMVVEAWDSAVAKQLSFHRPKSAKELRVLVFTPLMGHSLQEIEFMKEGPLSTEDVSVVVNALSISARVSADHQDASNTSGGASHTNKTTLAPRSGLKADRSNRGAPPQYTRDESPEGLRQSIEEDLSGLGARVHLPTTRSKEVALDLCRQGRFDKLWGSIAGYEEQKRQIEDSLLLSLLDPSALDKISRGTREEESARPPKAVLFDGPPGTGKTSSARQLASMAVMPLVYVPIESITSKYYGESEKRLTEIFAKCRSFEEGCIIFLDEVDALVTSRDGGEMHDATRRILGVLLKEVDGFEDTSRSVVIAATNRRQDLDAALTSRFDTVIQFDLPDAECRRKILGKYAKHLETDQIARLGAEAEGFSGRDLKDACLQAERQWASKIVRKEVKEWSLPPFEAYLKSVDQRKGHAPS